MNIKNRLYSYIAGIMLMLVTQSAVAGIKTETLPTTAGAELQDGEVYIVDKSMSIDAGATGKSALTVTANSTVTIYIAKNVTLTLKGGNGNGVTGAMPAILVSRTSTLIITGEGTLNATGGNAGEGGQGENGGDAWLHWRDNCGAGGAGGAGGYGGGGAAPAIGGIGGAGGVSKNGPDGLKRWCNGNDFDGSGVNGNPTVSGSNGTEMGKVYILGTVHVNATPGRIGTSSADAGSRYGNDATDSGSGWCNNYTSGAGGPGGGGGSGYAPSYGIGGGAPGGQSGSTGGSGGTMKNSSGRDYVRGAGGRGGHGGLEGKSSSIGSSSAYGKNGGTGGDVTTNSASWGGDGSLYMMSTAIVNCNGRKGDNPWTMPSKIKITYTLVHNGGTSTTNSVEEYYGVKHSKVAIPTNGTKTFEGYYTNADGTGDMVFDAAGNPTGICTDIEDRQLYAKWFDNYIKTTGNEYFQTEYKKGTTTSIVMVDPDGIRYTDISLIDGTIAIKGSLKYFEIWENGKLVRRYVPAKHNSIPCLFEEIATRSYIYQSSGTPEMSMTSCSHTLNEGRSAFHTTGQTNATGNDMYEQKQCYLCDAVKQVLVDENYMELNGEGWFSTDYIPNDNTVVYASMRYGNNATATDKEIGGGSSYSNTIPMGNYYKYSLSEMIYRKSEIGGAGTITKIAFNVNKSSANTLTDMKIYMGYKNTDTFSGSTDHMSTSDLTLVYSGTPTIGSNTGWEEFKLSTPFDYNGQKNLVVVVCRASNKWNTDLKYTCSTNNNCTLYRGTDTEDSHVNQPDNNTIKLSVGSDRADIKFTLETIKSPENPYGVKGNKGYFGLQFAYDTTDRSWSNRTDIGHGDYTSSAGHDVFMETDYLSLLSMGDLNVSEKDLPTSSVTQMSWTPASGLSFTQPLYLGALNSDCEAKDPMKGRIYSFTIMEKGQQIHHFIPATNNGQVGFYDEVTNKFKKMDGTGSVAVVQTERCQHRYVTVHSDGEQYTYCPICGKRLETLYYNDITYDANNSDAKGVMKDQTIVENGSLSAATYTTPMHKFKGWSTTNGVQAITYKNQANIRPSSATKGKISLYAQWGECYAVCGDTILIPDNSKVDSICLKEEDRQPYGFSTLKKINIGYFSYTRKLPTNRVWGTICSPVPLETNDSVTYYTNIRVYQNNKLILTPAVKVPAGTPCIFKIKNNKITHLKLETHDLDFDGSINNPTGSGLQLIGTYTKEELDCTSHSRYVISGNKFYLVTSSADITPFHAYIDIPQESARTASFLDIVDGEETGVTDLNENCTKVSDGMYLEKGFVTIIRDGQKYSITGVRK